MPLATGATFLRASMVEWRVLDGGERRVLKGTRAGRRHKNQNTLQLGLRTWKAFVRARVLKLVLNSSIGREHQRLQRPRGSSPKSVKDWGHVVEASTSTDNHRLKTLLFSLTFIHTHGNRYKAIVIIASRRVVRSSNILSV